MSHNLGGLLDSNAGRYGGSDRATAAALMEVQRNFQNMAPEPVLVVAARAAQPGHYYVLELQGTPTSDGTVTIPADYGLARSDNVIIGINMAEQGLTTWWVNSGTTIDGSRRRNAGSNQLDVDTIMFFCPFNYAGTHRADGGTGGATNTGGFGGPVGDGTSTGSGYDPGDDPNGGIGGLGGGGGTGSGFGGGTGDGGPQRTGCSADCSACCASTSLTINVTDSGGAYEDDITASRSGCAWSGSGPVGTAAINCTVVGGLAYWELLYSQVVRDSCTATFRQAFRGSCPGGAWSLVSTDCISATASGGGCSGGGLP